MILEVTGRRELQKRLKAEGLPHAKQTIQRYQDLGIIAEPEVRVVYEDREWRFYTLSQLDGIVRALREYHRG